MPREQITRVSANYGKMTIMVWEALDGSHQWHSQITAANGFRYVQTGFPGMAQAMQWALGQARRVKGLVDEND